MYQSFVSENLEQVILPGDVGVLLEDFEHVHEFVGRVGRGVPDSREEPAVKVFCLDGDHVRGLGDQVDGADGNGDSQRGREGA
jgi:hypothetical protein